jgi:hypothetical protein
MLRRLSVLALFMAAGWNIPAQTSPPRSEFKPAPEVPATPKALMKLPRTAITRAKFPVIDCHLHGGALRTAEDYRKMISLMDKTGLAMICNMDGSSPDSRASRKNALKTSSW